MDRCKGLTVVSHKDLIDAVDCWKGMKTYYDNVNKSSIEYAIGEFSKLPWYTRFVRKYTTCEWLIFIPMVTVFKYAEEDILKYRSDAGNYYMMCNSVREYFSEYYNNKVDTARQCERHSLIEGLHYLNDYQVEFVKVFKEIISNKEKHYV